MPVLLQIHDKPQRGGGLRTVVDDIDRTMRARGWEVRELCLVRGPATAGDTATLRYASVASPDDPAVAAVFRAVAGADVVHLHLGFTALTPQFIAAAAQVPLVVGLHDVSPFQRHLLADRWPEEAVAHLPDALGAPLARLHRLRHRSTHRAVWAALVGAADLMVVPGTYLARLAAEAGADPARIRCLPHAVDWAADHSALPPPSAAAPIALYAGRLSAAKGAPLLIEAFAHAQGLPPGAGLVVCGEGPARASMERRAAALGLMADPARPDSRWVRFTGACGREDLRERLLGARCLAHPSLVPEGFGLSGVEAMALGRPVAGLGRGGSADWLRDGDTGLIAAEPTPRALAAALTRLLSDPALADRLGRQARRHVQMLCAPDDVHTRMADLYNRLLACRPRAQRAFA